MARIQRVANSEDDSISDLTHEILKDVALTNKLLRLVKDVLHNPRESVVVRIGMGRKASFCSQ